MYQVPAAAGRQCTKCREARDKRQERLDFFAALRLCAKKEGLYEVPAAAYPPRRVGGQASLKRRLRQIGSSQLIGLFFDLGPGKVNGIPPTIRGNN